MKNSAAEILSQIDELKKKYDEMNNDIAVLEREVTQAQNELQAQENVFTNSVQSVINTLNTDKAKVTNLDI
jgi:peptidoglycan hydrolase CwlO-like protein